MDANSKISVLMFPWLAHGHISPFLELAKKLSKRNFDIYLLSTPANLGSIKQKIGENFSIQLVELHLPTLPNLPPQYHTTNGLPPNLMPTLKKAFDMANPNFAKILKTLKPDLLIYDFLQPWAPKVALEHNIPGVEFVSSSATMTAYMLDKYKNPGMGFPFPEIYYRNYENVLVAKLRESAGIDANGKTRGIESMEQSSKIVLIKTFREIEGKYCDYVSKLGGKKVVPLGPLVQNPDYECEDSEIIQWLNKKAKNSTVFVSFGSEYFLSEEDLEEIAHGLALSNVNFIWVVRFPMGESSRLEEALPQKFLQKVGGRGMVVEGWAPQSRILGHPSIGGFVSHCGWSSVIEGMKFGVPIIAMPMQLDQPINARLIEEVGVGVEAVRDKDGRLQREKVASVIKQVVVEEEGEVVRKKARELSDNIRLKGDEEIDVVVEELVQLCREKKCQK
ncbi:hypothetical protein RJ639_022435 [Escallonia herrerae]|uniref:Glycosyltransferase n=1 Tax=Escallonia herrerae TaxID=1293975 RepID=A0AA88V5N3_9ASTE|nr:hypothetical protein RJ639_022435 [Escallonia herrerae]